MCHITNVAHTRCVHATQEIHSCLKQEAMSLFSLGSGIPFRTHCDNSSSEERWVLNFCPACNVLWASHDVSEKDATERTLEYRNQHQYAGPLTPCPSFMGAMHVVEDAKLSESEKLLKEDAWDYDRRHHQKGRTRIDPDEASEFAKRLPKWVDAPEEEELRAFYGSRNASGSDWDTSTKTRQPRFKPKQNPMAERLEHMNELGSSPRRLELAHPDNFELANIDMYLPGAVGGDGFETQALRGLPGPMPREVAQRSALFQAPPLLKQREVHESYQLPANEATTGRSLTHPLREIAKKPVQIAKGKFAEQI